MKGTKRSRVKSTLLPFDVATERTDPAVTSFAGLPLAVEAWHALGLGEACEKHVKLKERQRGMSEAEWIEMLVMLRMAGGETAADLAALKEDAGLLRIWSLPEKASPRSVYQFLERFHDKGQPEPQPGKAVIREETAGLKGLAEVNRELLRRVQKAHPVDEATLDHDASIHESTKRSALWTYEGTKGYQPAATYWAEQGLVVHDQFRDGNVPAGMGQLDLAKAAFAMLPEGIERRSFRADSASYDHKLMRWLDREGIRFAITADMSKALRAEIEKVAETEWRPVYKRLDGDLTVKTEKQCAEVAFVPDDGVARKGERPFRYVSIRVPKQRELAFDAESDTSGWRHFGICTNDWDLDAEALIWWHRERCGSVEKLHDILKNDEGCGTFPSQHFGANAAWYRLGIIAYNLQRAMEHVCLPEEWKGERPSTLRFRFFRLAGRIVKHARRHLLVLSTRAAPMLPMLYVAARGLLVDLAGG